MTIVSFHTGGKYGEQAKRLARSCDHFRLPHKIFEIPPQRSWHESIFIKPGIIMQMLMQTRDSVCWIDADCEVRQPPVLLANMGADFMVYNWRADRDNTLCEPYDPERMLCSSGVILFGYSAASMELLVRWQNALRGKTERADDEILDDVWHQSRPPVNAAWLPKTYNWMEGKWGKPPEDVVIWHEYDVAKNRKAGA